MADISINTDHASDSAVLSGILDDLVALRHAVVLITAKLDLDVGVADVNYAATCDPAELVTVP